MNLTKLKENKMKKLLFVVIGVIAVIGLLTAFDGDGRRFDDGEHYGMRGKMFKNGEHNGMMQGMHNNGYRMMYEELNLTNKQKEQMNDLRIEEKKGMIVIEADLKLLEIDKRSAMKDKDFKIAENKTKEIFKIKEQAAIKRIEHQEQRWNILTPEQKKKAEELMLDHPRREFQDSPKLKKIKRK